MPTKANRARGCGKNGKRCLCGGLVGTIGGKCGKRCLCDGLVGATRGMRRQCDANGRLTGAAAVANGRLQEAEALNPENVWVRQLEPGNLAQEVRGQLQIVFDPVGALVALGELHP